MAVGFDSNFQTVTNKHLTHLTHLTCSHSTDKTVCYGVAMMLVNVTNTFDKPAKKPEEEEMRKLGKFAGEHIPEPHPMDSEEATKAR